MLRLIRYLLFTIVIILPGYASAANVKAFQHFLSIYNDEKEAQLKLPEGVACNDKSDVIVADSGNGRLVRYKFQDGKLTGGTEIKIPELPYPVRLQISSKGEIRGVNITMTRS